jgi:hypothetical protein
MRQAVYTGYWCSRQWKNWILLRNSFDLALVIRATEQASKRLATLLERHPHLQKHKTLRNM